MPRLSRKKLLDLLGMRAPPIGSPEFSIVGRDRRDGVELQEMRLGPARIPALRLVPESAAPGGPAILYAHAHGNRPDIGKSEVIEGRPALRDPPLGLTLARAGAVVLCPDLPGFGARQGEGTESSLAKAALWQGRTLIGEMLEDLELALGALEAMPQVDPANIKTVGISMGGTLAYLLAALHPGITACAQLCVMADIAPLIETGTHDLHGSYMTIPGLLPGHDLGEIAGLTAPRPHFIATGARDPLTPDPAYASALARLKVDYAEHPENLTLIRDPNAGHEESPEMRAALFAFLGLTAR